MGFGVFFDVGLASGSADGGLDVIACEEFVFDFAFGGGGGADDEAVCGGLVDGAFGEFFEEVVAEFDEPEPVDAPALFGFHDGDGDAVRDGVGDDFEDEEAVAGFLDDAGVFAVDGLEGGGAVVAGGGVGFHEWSNGFRIEDVGGARGPVRSVEEGFEGGFGDGGGGFLGGGWCGCRGGRGGIGVGFGWW